MPGHRMLIVAAGIRIRGGGWTQGPAAVDGFELQSDHGAATVLGNDQFEITAFRRPVPGPRPAIGLTAMWEGRADAVVLAAIRER